MQSQKNQGSEKAWQYIQFKYDAHKNCRDFWQNVAYSQTLHTFFCISLQKSTHAMGTSFQCKRPHEVKFGIMSSHGYIENVNKGQLILL